MLKKWTHNEVTKNFSEIKKRIEDITITKELKNIIKTKIKFLNHIFKNELQFVVHGSFAMNGGYKIDDFPIVDILAIKYVSTTVFDIYENELETYIHFDDCLICELNKKIFDKTSKTFNEDKVYFKISKFLNETFQDVIVVDFYNNSKILYRFKIRVCLKSRKQFALICDKNIYHRSMSINVLHSFKILNKILNRKLEILFYEIYLSASKKYSKKEIFLMKIAAISKLEKEIISEQEFRSWVTYLFFKYFKSEKFVNNLVGTKNPLIVHEKFINKIYHKIQLKNMSFIYRNIYGNDLKNFIVKNLSYVFNFIKNINNKNDESSLWILYDINLYLTDQYKNNKILFRNWRKLTEDSGIMLDKKYLYPDDKNIGMIVMFVIYFKFEIILN